MDPAAAARPETPSLAAPASGLGAAATAGWVLALAAVAGLLQLVARIPYDADSAYHVAVARLLRTHGILHAFPWTPFSWLADHYADKELLFHALLVPLASLDWTTAARIAGTLCGAAALAAGYAILRLERVPGAEAWSLVPLACSGGYLFRFALVRPHLLSIALGVVVTWAAARRRLPILAVACFLYPFTYIGWPLALVLVALAEGARLASGERPAWRPPAVAAGALLLGLVAHPNFPDLARFTWLVNVGILVDAAWIGRAGIELGLEFEPYAARDALRFLLLPGALLAIGAVLAWRVRREDSVPLAFAAAAALLFALTLRTARFVEYAVPFSVLAAALAAARTGVPRPAVAAVLGGSVAFTALLSPDVVTDLARRGDDVPPSHAEAFRALVPPGAQVFTCEWGLTGSLMLALPERRFLVALDPVLFWKKDPGRYEAWRRLVSQGGPGAAEEIRRLFGARYVLCAARPPNAPLLRSLTATPGVLRALKSPLWLAYDLDPGAPAGGAPPGR